jgi:serine/threonine-protein kinase
MGSYLCEIEHPGRATVRYPIVIRREGHWHAVPPGGSEPEPVWLPPAGSLGPDEIYIPAGWFRAGDDTLPNHPQQDLWCHGFVIDRFSVTNREYIVFLDDLVANGHVDAALRHAPRNRPGREGELGNLIFGFDGRHFYLVADAEGDIWQPDWPVFHVDWHSANAYLAWRAERTGTPWRLPAELEWEKAARGVDGRTYPWGDHFDPSWCRMVESQRGADHGDFGPESIHSYPVDTSCYDVRGLAGNIHDWCLDRYEPLPVTEGGRVVVPEVASYAGAPGFRATRGGTWTSNRRSCKCAARFLIDVSYGASVRGFRGAYSLGPHR